MKETFLEVHPEVYVSVSVSEGIRMIRQYPTSTVVPVSQDVTSTRKDREVRIITTDAGKELMLITAKAA